MHYIGIKAEYAVATYLGRPIALPTGGRSDDGWDIEYRGWTIDVKARRHVLSMPKERPIKADVLVCVMHDGTTDHMMIVGWVSAREFLKRSYTSTWTGGETFRCMKSETLNDMRTLRDAAERPVLEYATAGMR